MAASLGPAALLFALRLSAQLYAPGQVQDLDAISFLAICRKGEKEKTCLGSKISEKTNGRGWGSNIACAPTSPPLPSPSPPPQQLPACGTQILQ
jgi:hypothetical protein